VTRKNSYPIGMRLVDTSGTGYAGRVAGEFNEVETVDGKRVGDLDPLQQVLLVRSARHGRVLSLVPDLSDLETRRLLAASVGPEARNGADKAFVLTRDLLSRVRAGERTTDRDLTAAEVVRDHAGDAVGPGVYIHPAGRWVIQFRRDPDADCDDFEPGPAGGRCWTDGHYLCDLCKQRDPDHQRETE
jgi:hypothetical protein